jgi:hypothetical protein
MMKIEFSIEDNELMYDVLDGVFITLLKKELKDSKEFLGSGHQHPEDVKQYKKNIKACEVLLKYYGGLDE